MLHLHSLHTLSSKPLQSNESLKSQPDSKSPSKTIYTHIIGNIPYRERDAAAQRTEATTSEASTLRAHQLRLFSKSPDAIAAAAAAPFPPDGQRSLSQRIYMCVCIPTWQRCFTYLRIPWRRGDFWNVIGIGRRERDKRRRGRCCELQGIFTLGFKGTRRANLSNLRVF